MLTELRKLTSDAANLAMRSEEEEAAREVYSDNPLATWWIQKTPGTTYWRAQIPARHLPGQALALRWSDVKIGDDGEVVVPRQRGEAIFQFVGNATRALIMAHLQEQGHKVLMEVDDNYLVPPPHVPGLRGDWQVKVDRTPEDRYSYQAHRKIVGWVDGMIVSTDHLAEQYEKVTSAPIHVCPNSVDPDDWPEIEERDGPRSIGYAGSGSHRYDVGLIERGLTWAAHQGTDVYKLGVGEARWAFAKQVPWTDDLAQYRRNLQVLDVGLCPLKRNTWADGKSDIKAIEYILAGAVPIVQKAPPYADWLDIVPACETEKDWLKAIKWAVSAPADELREVWTRAHSFLLQRKLIGQHIEKWREAIAS